MITTSVNRFTHIVPSGDNAVFKINMKLIFEIIFILTLQPVVWSAPRKPRLSLAAPSPSYYYRNIDNIPGTYSYGYDVYDQELGNSQFRNEERFPNGTVVGSYGFMDALGKARRFDYIADENGYRVKSWPSRRQNGIDNNINVDRQTTESSVTWKRGSNKKKINKNQNISRRKFNTFQPPSYYALY